MKTVVKREKGRVDLFGERFRARAHQRRVCWRW